ncbi:MAG: hypothetical protein EU532_01025 [Promethearchaeota archaeon]|nr:MAG: hypothetical protein EU532_01025 [Candidatus Lokiarchaeota archaeon]
MENEVNKAKTVFKEAWDALNNFFEEKRSDTIVEKEEKAKKGKVALAKFSKGMIGKTNQINFRILIGHEKVLGDHIYEAVYMDDKKEPYIYDFTVNQGKSVNTILINFKEDSWNGYSKVKKFKSLTKFLEHAYKDGIYYEGKKIKKDEALDTLIKEGLKRSLEAISEDANEKYGIDSETAKKVAKVVVIAAATTVVSAALTPAAGVVVAEVAGGAPFTGELAGQAAQAAVEGVQNLADPTTIARKVAQKALTKGKNIGKE